MTEREILLHYREVTYPLAVSRYPDGMPLVQRLQSYDLMLLRPRSVEALMVGLWYTQAMVARGHSAGRLALPLIPGGRQDRLLQPRTQGDGTDALFTLRSVAEAVNACGYREVLTLDPHSDVTPALLNNVRVITAADVVRKYQHEFPTYDGVIAPDAGATRRAHGVARVLGIPLYQAWKQRDTVTGVLSGFGVQPLPPGRFLVVDDLCDGGGTFVGLAKQVNTAGQKCDLYVSHGLFTKGTAELLQWYGRIITTDSTLHDKPGCTTLPVTMNWD